MRQEILKGGSDSLRLSLFDHGRAVQPSSCSARILDIGGNLLASGDAAGGIYSPPASVSGQARQDCTVEWTYTYDGITDKRVELFDVVLFRLYPVATEADMIRESPSLVSSERVYRGTVNAADSSSITSNSLLGTREDWSFAIIQLLTGTEAGKQYVVSAFDAGIGKASYPAASAASPGDTFLLRRSYQSELDAAWDDVIDRLTQACANSPVQLGLQQTRPFLVMTPDRLRRPHLSLALSKAHRGIATDQNGVDWAKAEYYAAEYEGSWAGLKLVFAQPGDFSAPLVGEERSTQWGFSR